VEGGDRGPAIVPGRADESLLITAVRYVEDDLQMPPEARLDDAILADLRRWIDDGAVWPAKGNAPEAGEAPAEPHWAFQPVALPPIPDDASGWSESAIDRFVTVARREHDVEPVADVSRRVLARRLYFDLSGLPPLPDEIDAFVGDPRPDALERLVDRLLASPRYGERWGRHWMDVVRYADTAGDNADYPIPEARLYRDFVIDSLNADKPYDQFVREQLAGDVLAREGPSERYAEQVVATGFLALSRRYATAPYELWHLTLEDTIDTTGRAFLGLTLRCARCHDHKFDPVTREDYYGLYGIFASTQFPWAGAEEFQSKAIDRQHFQPLLPPDEARPLTEAQAARMKALDEQIAAADSPEKKGPLEAEKKRIQRSGLPEGLEGAYAVSEATPADAAVQLRGDPGQPGDVVPRRPPRFLLQSNFNWEIAPGSSGRLDLARWIASPDNPLTARVMVNRLWQHHFGRGIVATASNFGTSGAEPTHRELLDYLASRFVESGWSIKKVQRIIVTSRAYRLGSGEDTQALARDPDNRWLWRYDRRRLDAEAIRDAMLSVSGQLDLARPGRHPFPAIHEFHWSQHDPFKAVYPSRNRSVYLMTQRIQRHPYLALFDGPDTNTTTDARPSSTVPLQALYLLNDPWVHEQAEHLASRLLADASQPSVRIEQVVQLCWGRSATKPEIERAERFLSEYRAALTEAGTPPERVDLEAWSAWSRVLLTASEFLYVE
jgi:hypothetical protein